MLRVGLVAVAVLLLLPDPERRRGGGERADLVLPDQVSVQLVDALRARDGHVFWTYHASGAVKGGPALANGILYFGDYAGRAYALNANTGHQIWAVSTDGAHFGFGSGNFYSTPAIAFGRVYMGNTDGRVYSFAARTGQLAWATATGAYVYASPAVADLAGIGPTVYIGSYDGNFYAFNAQSGAVRWRHPVGNRISGSATIVDGVVYFSAPGLEDDPRSERAHWTAGVLVPGWRLQPRRRGRWRDLPERLFDALPVAAEAPGAAAARPQGHHPCTPPRSA